MDIFNYLYWYFLMKNIKKKWIREIVNCLKK